MHCTRTRTLLFAIALAAVGCQNTASTASPPPPSRQPAPGININPAQVTAIRAMHRAPIRVQQPVPALSDAGARTTP